MRTPTLLVLVWAILGAVSVAWAMMSLALFGRVDRVKSANEVFKDTATTIQGSLFIAVCLVGAWGAISLVVLTRRSCQRKTDASFCFGVLLTSTLYTAFIFLSAGLAVNSGESQSDNQWQAATRWGNSDHGLLLAVMVISYMMAVLLLVYAAMLACTRNAFKDQPKQRVSAPGTAEPMPAVV